MKKGDHRKAALVGLRIVCHATLSAWSAAWDAVLLVWLLYGKPPMVSLGHVLLKPRSWFAYSKRQDKERESQESLTGEKGLACRALLDAC